MMRHKLKFLMLLTGVLILSPSLSAWAAHMGGTVGHGGAYTSVPAENIKNTLHNLSSSSINSNNLVLANITTAEVCVFCHTPHGADTANLGGPLWNRNTSTQTYALYSGPNLEVTSTQPQGVSLACLSCHDGAAAVDALINSSGSGKYKIVAVDVTTGLMGDQTTGSRVLLDIGNTMTEGIRTDTGTNYDVIATGAAPFPNLTLNLSDDHPISLKICLDNGTNPGTGGAGSDPQFIDVCTKSPAQTATGLRFLTRSATAVINTDPRDRVRTYPTPGVATAQFVECASCHNPHAPRPLFLRLPSPGGENAIVAAIASGGGTATVANAVGGADATLLADKPNAGSLVCITCHQK